ncbi:MAG: hypothetical protein ACI35R_06245 [Bacillus sp. (in: firmicutes)]
MYRRTLSTVLALGMVLSTGAAYAEPIQNTPHEISTIDFDTRISKVISSENMYNTILDLTKQSRAAGTEGELEAVQYIANKFIPFNRY